MINIKSKLSIKTPWIGPSLGIAAAMTSLALLFSNTAVDIAIRSLFIKPVEVKARDLIDLSPAFNKKVKVFGYDDKAFAKQGKENPTTEEWLAILKSIKIQKPKAIYIDKIFYNTQIQDLALYNSLSEELKSSPVPIYVGAYTMETELAYRKPYKDLKNRYDLWNIFVKNASTKNLHQTYDKFSTHILYSHDEKLYDLINGIGQFNFHQGRIYPYIFLPNNKVIPHLTLSGIKDVFYQNENFLFADKSLAVYKDGSLVPNYSNFKELSNNVYSINYLYDKIKSNKPASFIQEGDLVLLIPFLYTGNSDMKDTPIGNIPGGYIIATMLSNLASGNWTKVLHNSWAFYGCAILLGLLVNFLGNSFMIMFMLISISVGILLGGLISFSYFNIELPWSFSLFCFFGQGLLTFLIKNWYQEKRNQLIKFAIEGSVSNEALRDILKNNSKVSFDASEQVISVMFIDIVNFSPVAERLKPKDVFKELKKNLDSLSKIIHAHGGIIDRTLGDGLLCYFGSPLGTESHQKHHADLALQCAINIQKTNIDSIRNKRNTRFAFSYRIGINTSPCFIGDIGSDSRIDLTIVGNGVNLAKRLESACKPNLILFTQSTRDYLSPEKQDLEFRSRFIKVKHHRELMQVYELNPFSEFDFLLIKELNNEQTNLKKPVEVEYDQDRYQNFAFFLNDSPAKLIKLTSKELTLQCDIFLLEEQTVDINIRPMDKTKMSPQITNLLPLSGVVLWNIEDKEGNQNYGIEISSLNESKINLLLRLLKAHQESQYSDNLVNIS